MEEIKSVITKSFEKTTELIIDPLKNRVSNSLIGSFIISWIFINWKVILFVIFSTKTIEQKFYFIDNHLYGSINENWIRYFFIPLGLCAFYAIAFPFIDQAVDYLNIRPKKAKINRNSELVNEELDRKLEVVGKESELEERKTQYNTIEKKNLEIKRLEGDLEKLQIQFDNTSVKLNDSIQLLNAGKITLTNEIKEKSDLYNENERLKTGSINLFDFLLQEYPIKTLTDVIQIEEAVEMYFSGTEKEFVEKLKSTLNEYGDYHKSPYVLMDVSVRFETGKENIASDLYKIIAFSTKDSILHSISENHIHFQFFAFSGNPERLEEFIRDMLVPDEVSVTIPAY